MLELFEHFIVTLPSHKLIPIDIDSKMMDGWMDKRCLRPLFCTIKAELGWGQPGR